MGRYVTEVPVNDVGSVVHLCSSGAELTKVEETVLK